MCTGFGIRVAAMSVAQRSSRFDSSLLLQIEVARHPPSLQFVATAHDWRGKQRAWLHIRDKLK